MNSLINGEFLNTDLFRGEEMKLCQIYFQSEAAYACVSQLGECGVVQFNDVNISILKRLVDAGL
jgi:hypothetical protein